MRVTVKGYLKIHSVKLNILVRNFLSVLNSMNFISTNTEIAYRVKAQLQLKINTNFKRKSTFQCPGRIEFFSVFNEFIFNNYIMKC